MSEINVHTLSPVIAGKLAFLPDNLVAVEREVYGHHITIRVHLVGLTQPIDVATWVVSNPAETWLLPGSYEVLDSMTPEQRAETAAYWAERREVGERESAAMHDRLLGMLRPMAVPS